MIPRLIRRAAVGVLLVLVAAPLSAADKATGTFTVEGKTVRFTEVYASLERDPVQAGRKYLMLLVTDVAVAPADRVPNRLLALARAGTIHAVRIRWTYGEDNSQSCPTIATSRRAAARFSDSPR
jgi:hypothetical protein